MFHCSIVKKVTRIRQFLLLDWIYDENIVYLPASSGLPSQHSNYEPQFEDLSDSQHQESFNMLKHYLRETGYHG